MHVVVSAASIVNRSHAQAVLTEWLCLLSPSDLSQCKIEDVETIWKMYTVICLLLLVRKDCMQCLE